MRCFYTQIQMYGRFLSEVIKYSNSQPELINIRLKSTLTFIVLVNHWFLMTKHILLRWCGVIRADLHLIIPKFEALKTHFRKTKFEFHQSNIRTCWIRVVKSEIFSSWGFRFEYACYNFTFFLEVFATFSCITPHHRNNNGWLTLLKSMLIWPNIDKFMLRIWIFNHFG